MGIKHCGRLIPPGSKYCPHCGAQIDVSVIADGKHCDRSPDCDICECEICGAPAKHSYEFDMYLIEGSHKESLVSKRMHYRYNREKVSCCDRCYSSLNRADKVLAICFVILWFALSLTLAYLYGKDGLASYLLAFFWCFFFAGIFMVPFMCLFSGERRICRKVKRIANLVSYGWQFGKKPTNADYHWKDYHKI